MKIYRSRIGWEIWMPVMAILGYEGYIFITNGIWPGILFLCGFFAFLVFIAIQTRYIISGDTLKVKSWCLDLDISIKSIHRIRKTNNINVSPAAAFFGRIEVFYDTGKSTIISPKDKRGFIDDLLSRTKSILTFEVR